MGEIIYKRKTLAGVAGDAVEVNFDSTATNLEGNNVQDAIQELDAEVNNVQDAIQELDAEVTSLNSSFTNNLTNFIRVVACSSSSQTISANSGATYSFDSYVPDGYTSIICVPRSLGTNYSLMDISTISNTTARAINRGTSNASFAMGAYLICVKSEFLS